MTRKLYDTLISGIVYYTHSNHAPQMGPIEARMHHRASALVDITALIMTRICYGIWNSSASPNQHHQPAILLTLLQYNILFTRIITMADWFKLWWRGQIMVNNVCEATALCTWGVLRGSIWSISTNCGMDGPLTRYVKLPVAHAPGMPRTFPPAADFKVNCWLAFPACITVRAWRTCRNACRDCLPAVAGKTIPAFPAHAYPQFYVSGTGPMVSSSKL